MFNFYLIFGIKKSKDYSKEWMRENVDIVCNALDNIKARKFMDEKCI
jgi:hypothetical protein